MTVAAFAETALISGLPADLPDPDAMAAAGAVFACLANTQQGAASCAQSAWQASSYTGDVSWQALETSNTRRK